MAAAAAEAVSPAAEVEPRPETGVAPAAASVEEAASVDASAWVDRVAQILHERPDVLGGFYTAYYETGAHKHPALWAAEYGGATPEDYAKHWYDRHGKWEGYALGGDGVDVERLLNERPDVLKSYYVGFYEGGNSVSPDAWITKVGGAAVEDYAKYWYDRHGKWEGYSQSGGDTLSAARILEERPDVLRAFYTGFYEEGAFKHPGEWIARMGGRTPEDFAKAWYDQHGKWEGYSQAPPPAAAPEDLDLAPPQDAPLPPESPDPAGTVPAEALDDTPGDIPVTLAGEIADSSGLLL